MVYLLIRHFEVFVKLKLSVCLSVIVFSLTGHIDEQIDFRLCSGAFSPSLPGLYAINDFLVPLLWNQPLIITRVYSCCCLRAVKKFILYLV